MFIAAAALTTVLSCQKNTLSSVENLENTAWAWAYNYSECILVFGPDGKVYDLVSLQGVSNGAVGTYVYSNPSVLINIGEDSLTGTLSSDGKTMVVISESVSMTYSRHSSSLSSMSGTTWKQTGITGASISLSFTSGTDFTATQSIIGSTGVVSKTDDGLCSYSNPVLVLETEGDDVSIDAVGIVSYDGSNMLLYNESGSNTISFGKE